MTYDKVELHLCAAPLSRAHAKRIKASGGNYSECRSPYATTRFVTVPATERDLIDTLVRNYFNGKRMTMIARGGDNRPAWVTVQYVSDPVMCGKDAFEQFERGYAKAYAQAVRRGIITEKGVDNAKP